MWWTLLAPLATSIFGKDGIIGTYIATKQAIQQKKQDNEFLLEQGREDRIKQQGIDAVESEKNKLAATSQTFKAVSFLLLNIPIIITCLSKTRGADLWGNLNLVPVWYAQLYVSVVFVIWGLPVVANATGTIFQAIQDAWDARNQGKIQKIQAMGNANQIGKEAAKKEILDTFKTVTGLKGYSTSQAEAIIPILDKFVSGAQQQPTSNVTVNTRDQQ